MKFLLNTEIDRKNWEDLLNESPFASPFQTTQFYEFLNAVPGFGAAVAAVEYEGKYCALAVVALQKENGIKGYFSRRAIIYGGPLCEPSRPEALEMLLVKLSDSLQNKVIYIEVRNLFDYGDHREVFFQHGWEYIPYLNIHLVLSEKSLNNVLAGMNYNRRQQIKISIQEGASYAECKDESELKALYSILADLYKERVKLPLPSFHFFDFFFRSEIGKVFVVKHNNIVIGGSFCPVLPNRMIYTFYYCGIRNYHKKIFPTHLAVLAAIEYGIKNKFILLDFMGAGKPDLEYGVRKYKKEFGGELVEYGRFLRVTKPLLYSFGKAGVDLIARFN